MFEVADGGPPHSRRMRIQYGYGEKEEISRVMYVSSLLVTERDWRDKGERGEKTERG